MSNVPLHNCYGVELSTNCEYLVFLRAITELTRLIPPKSRVSHQLIPIFVSIVWGNHQVRNGTLSSPAGWSNLPTSVSEIVWGIPPQDLEMKRTFKEKTESSLAKVSLRRFSLQETWCRGMVSRWWLWDNASESDSSKVVVHGDDGEKEEEVITISRTVAALMEYHNILAKEKGRTGLCKIIHRSKVA